MNRSKLLFSLFLALGVFEYFGPRLKAELLIDLSIVLFFSLWTFKQCQRRCLNKVIFWFRYGFFSLSMLYLSMMFLYIFRNWDSLTEPVSSYWINAVHAWFFCSLGVAALNFSPFLRFIGDLQRYPARFIATVYVGVAVAAAFLLTWPVSLEPQVDLSLLDAFFTSVSAISGTGLVVVNTAETFSRFGEIIILLVVQAGGVGIITFSGMLLLILGRELGLHERVIQDDTERMHYFGDLKSFTAIVAAIMLTLQTMGAVLLYPFMRGLEQDPGEAVFQAIFHSVSAFCTAGFTTLPTGMEMANGSPYPLIVVGALSILGMLGLPTLINLCKWVLPRGERLFRISAYSKLELLMGGTILVFGMISLFIVELGSLEYSSWRDTLIHSFFQSAMRNAGFNSIPLDSYGLASAFILMSLMIVGGAPMSTAGGIKTATLGIILIFVMNFIRGAPDANFAGRRIPPRVFTKAVTLIFLFFSVLFFGFVSLILTQPDLGTVEVLFEAISALTVTGFSLGITPELNQVGRSIVIALMLIGRIGLLTAIYAFVLGQRPVKYRLPQGEFYVG